MWTGRDLRRIIKGLKDELGIYEHVYVRVVPMKRSFASISFKTNVMRLNRDFLTMLSLEEVRFILAHELLHLKYGDVHSKEMREDLLRVCGEEVIISVMKKIEKYLKSKSKSKRQNAD